jgi:hypothetical protein
MPVQPTMSSPSFVDPRTNPSPGSSQVTARFASDPDALTEFHEMCRQGRLYDVERWIQTGHPLQVRYEPGRYVRGRRKTSALEIALDQESHALVLVLLCNGYDPNAERHSPLDAALRARRWDLVDLLLAWGADPMRVDLDAVFGTYRTELFERFQALGVDLTDGHALAEALADHTSNKPLYGFAKRHRERDPRFQTELNMALVCHAEEGNQKGVSLCLWAGADPHAPAPSLRYPISEEDDSDEDGFVGFSAVEQACARGEVEILERLGPDPERDDFDELYRATSSTAVIDILARSVLPKDVGTLLERYLWSMSAPWGKQVSHWTIQHLFEIGMRWQSSNQAQIANIRRLLLKTSDYEFIALVKLLAADDHCDREILVELGRTAAMRRRMKRVGFIPSEETTPVNRPTRSREVLARFGVELPKPKKQEIRLPHTVQIGGWRPGAHRIVLDRCELYERVWSEPMMKVAESWGLSGRGLAKACDRLRIPVPPRGYWAKVHAGKRPRRPKLPRLKPGEAEEIVIWVPNRTSSHKIAARWSGERSQSATGRTTAES